MKPQTPHPENLRVIVLDPKRFFRNFRGCPATLSRQIAQWTADSLGPPRIGSNRIPPHAISLLHSDVAEEKLRTLRYDDCGIAYTLRYYIAGVFRPLENWFLGQHDDGPDEKPRQPASRAAQQKLVLKLVFARWRRCCAPPDGSGHTRNTRMRTPQLETWIQSQQELANCVAERIAVVLAGPHPIIVSFVLDLLFEMANADPVCGVSREDWSRVINAIGEMSEWPVIVLTRD